HLMNSPIWRLIGRRGSTYGVYRSYVWAMLGSRWVVGAVLAVVGGLVATPGVAQAAEGPEVFVAPWGSDQAPGTLTRPVHSPQRARDLVRERNHDLAGDVTVRLAPGVYRMTEPLVLDARASGR